MYEDEEVCDQLRILPRDVRRTEGIGHLRELKISD